MLNDYLVYMYYADTDIDTESLNSIKFCLIVFR